MINTIDTESALRQAIARLEIRHAQEQAALKEELRVAFEGLTPANLIRTTMEEISMSKEIRSDLLQTSASLAAGFISRKIVEKLSHDRPRGEALGGELLTSAVGLVAQNPELTRTLGNAFFRMLRRLGSK